MSNNITHEVKLVLTVECSGEPMRPEELKQWFDEFMFGSEYAKVQVKEVTTLADGRVITTRSFIPDRVSADES